MIAQQADERPQLCGGAVDMELGRLPADRVAAVDTDGQPVGFGGETDLGVIVAEGLQGASSPLAHRVRRSPALLFGLGFQIEPDIVGQRVIDALDT